MMMGPCKEVLGQIQMDKEGRFKKDQIERFKTDPNFYRMFVRATEKEVNSNFPIVRPHPPSSVNL